MNGDNFSYLLMFYQCGTVFQTAFLTACYNPETSSRVTLASLGTVFQTALLLCSLAFGSLAMFKIYHGYP